MIFLMFQKKHPKNSFKPPPATYPVISHFPKGKNPGLIKIEAGRILHEHEIMIITKLLIFGDDIFCIAESNIIKTADIIWRNKEWELKSIKGDSKQTIEDSLRKARKQSPYIILDVSKSKISLERCIGKLKIILKRYRTIQEILIIDGNEYCILDKKRI